MHLFHFLEDGLYYLSCFFFYPVIVALFLLLLKTFYDLGLFGRDWFFRLRQRRQFKDIFSSKIAAISDSDVEKAELNLSAILQKVNCVYSKPLQSVRYNVKMGPTLGLIGTLTPMARALSGLSTGDLSSLSGQMIMAFSTTVLGLVISGISFSIAHMRSKWEKQDVSEISFLAENRLQQIKNNKNAIC